MKIDPKQKQLIHIAKVQLGLDDEHYRAIIAGRTKGKKTSSKELTYFEADSVINFLKTLGFKIKLKKARTRPARVARAYQTAKRDKGNLYVLPSREQLNMIETLKDKIAWRIDGGFQLWMRKYMHIARVKTEWEAEKVIEGLKGILEHQIKGAANG